ncbi:MAG: signal peptidase I [Ignavibacteria bacterium]|nr:MAG: signal peptidase I [Ignavibacteria bacterium]
MSKNLNERVTAGDQRKGGSAIESMVKELGIILGAFLILNSFVLASFEVPTGSMENEIMTGDFLLVNKFVFGGTTPRTIPLTNVRVPSFKLPAMWNVEKGDIIVFVFPGYRDEVEPQDPAYYLKRCIGTAGDTIQIINRVVYVNGMPAPVPRNVKFNSTLVKPPDYIDERIFPKGAPFNEDNYGPIVIPKKGDVIELTPKNFERWEIFIRREGHAAALRQGKVTLDGVQNNRYTVERNYLFGMGDNRDNSLDSRFWGFVPADAVVGTPLIVYWSWDPETPILRIAEKLSTVRLSRFGTIVR